jgi:hypothetical protein
VIYDAEKANVQPRFTLKQGLQMFFKRKKIFIVGCNKTGTSSIEAALISLGYKSGDQFKAELLMEDWARRDFSSLIKLCRKADVFQDVPFSMDHTYPVMDHVFPCSKFILTVRENSDVWFESTTRFLTKLVGKGRLPTADDLKTYNYRGCLPGWIWRSHQLIFGIDESTLFNRDIYIEHYETHNEQVRDYFKYRPDDLLELSLADPNSMKTLCAFLGADPENKVMPHLNRSTGDNDRA